MGAKTLNIYRELILEARFLLLTAVVMEIEGEDMRHEKHFAEMEILINQALLNKN